MVRNIAFGLTVLLLCSWLPSSAAAQDRDTKEREKVKSDLLLPECSWSKMSKEEYEACQEKRRTMKVMTPKERAEYLKHLEGTGSVSVDDTGGYGRNIIRNRPAPRSR